MEIEKAEDRAEYTQLCQTLCQQLAAEYAQRGYRCPFEFPSEQADFSEWWDVFRALVNVRECWPADPEFLSGQDRLLQYLIQQAGVTQPEDIPATPNDSRLGIWRGDITTLAADAIVNAANDRLTGCWAPNHYCIDNAIHTFAGVQLRLKCAEIMQQQGFPEPTGQAKVTPAYNLPSKYVIHTVGPIAQGQVTPLLESQLASSYASCLDAALQSGCSTLAFCCISTGVFGFPQKRAAQIAVNTVQAWLNEHDSVQLRVVFNVFGEKDQHIYQQLLG